MREQPKNRIANDALTAWRIGEGILMGILWLFVITYGIMARIFELDFLYLWIGIGVALVLSYLFIVLIPKIRWLRWRYEIFSSEIYIQHGLIIVTQTLVPMIRVQHVDTKQGPILKRFGLATVQISTAATVHEIPALLEEDAADLRDAIAELARVGEEDV